MVLLAAYCGIVNEDEILNMSYDWFTDMLDAMGEFVNYQAVVNYAGNAFCEKSWDMIMDSNPILKGQILTSDQRSWENFFNTAEIRTISKGEKQRAKENGGFGAGGFGN